VKKKIRDKRLTENF